MSQVLPLEWGEGEGTSTLPWIISGREVVEMDLNEVLGGKKESVLQSDRSIKDVVSSQ